uniref:Mitochondrial fission 1 protein n=1 Tax=Pseudo-nitzschia australis TaxID=44445 RepID=A0A7S4ACB2_9STRA|mmetsp:Transcript_1224/g.2789  ORF Transcript_1224/g.2789 Transcript_1224/m.2789 type:complete len:164 (+) Transcript_1224:117-608(+)
MGKTKNAQKQAKTELDQKLNLARPSRQILEDLAIACAKTPSQDNTFQYAFCLSKSSERSELRYAVQILDGLVKEGYEHQVDCMYGSACALYLLGEYDKARLRAENILRSHPESRLAREIHLSSIESTEQEDKQRIKEAAIGGATVAAAVGVAAGIASLLLTKR